MKSYFIVMAAMHTISAGLLLGGVKTPRTKRWYKLTLAALSLVLCIWSGILLFGGLTHGWWFVAIAFILEGMSIPMVFSKEFRTRDPETEDASRTIAGWISIAFALWAISLIA